MPELRGEKQEERKALCSAMLIAELGHHEGLLKKPCVLGALSASLINLNHGPAETTFMVPCSAKTV